jgi:hypothetical protein
MSRSLSTFAPSLPQLCFVRDRTRRGGAAEDASDRAVARLQSNGKLMSFMQGRKAGHSDTDLLSLSAG